MYIKNVKILEVKMIRKNVALMYKNSWWADAPEQIVTEAFTV